jgi:tetratricopeptide (TPR) repeat protein
MLAHHYLQSLELAEAAGLDTTALVEPARRALCDAGERAGALYSIDAAERFYDAALRLTPDDGPERADLLFRRAVPVGPHTGGGNVDRLEEARVALLASGPSAKLALIETLLSQAYWIQGKQELSDVHSERGLALLGDAEPSRETAWVLARHASRLGVAFDFERGIEAGRQTLEVAETIGWDEAASDALSTIGVARVALGDNEGLDDIERAIAVAEAPGARGTLSRAYNGLSVAHQILGDLQPALEARQQAADVIKPLGSRANDAWFEAALADNHFRLGDWAEAARLAGELIEAVESGAPSYVAFQAYIVRAELRLARGDDVGALSDAHCAAEEARSVGGRQILTYVLSGVPHVLALTGSDEAEASVRRFIDECGGGPLGFCAINVPRLAFAALRFGLEGEVLDALSAVPEGRWSDAVRALVEGDFVAAANLLERIGAKTDEAEARLQAGTAEQVERALQFYRSVGATRFIREGEALLAATP